MTRGSHLVAATLVVLGPMSGSIAAQRPAPRALQAIPSAPSIQAVGPHQAVQPQPRANDHRFRYLGAGAAIGGLLALGYYFVSENGDRAGRCAPANCALPYLSLSGALAGLFVAGDKAAQRRVETPRVGSVLEFRFADVAMLAPPFRIAVGDSLVAVASDSGVQLVSNAGRPVALRRRGAGLSGIRSVAIGPSTTGASESRLFIGTATALWEGSLGAGTLTRVFDGAVDAINADGPALLVASGPVLRIRRSGASDTRVDSLTIGSGISSIAYDPRVQHWWVTSDSALYEVSADGARPVAVVRARVSGQAGAVAVSNDWIAVALAGDGVALWPRAALAADGMSKPIEFRGEPRFAFDVAFVGNTLFIAGGVDGLTRVELTATPRILGSSRQLGYATSLSAENGVLWVGDRARSRVVRIPLDR